jgi:hexosaminidase
VIQPFPIIPKPQKMISKEGTYRLTLNSTISYTPEGERAATLLQKLIGLELTRVRGDVDLEINATIQDAEGYFLDIDENGIRIAASSPAGLFYGAQTLRQLLPPEVEGRASSDQFDVPFLHIEDAPRFSHRGFMLDVSRHFFGPEEIKRLIDLIALQKINRFHWHLTDDQGWRIEIKKHPPLTEIGAFRKESQTGGWVLSKPVFDGKPHGGFYTQDDVREIVAYARENFIEVIPEIDAPGHAIAAIAGYPELSCSGEPVEVRTSVGAFSSPMCVGNDFVFEFLEDVLSEVADLFPYQHIHIGGDEVNKKWWKKCPKCQTRKRELGLKTENDLQVYFENRLVSMLKSKGCQVIGWNEIIHEDLDKDVINQFWLNFKQKQTVAELKKGRKTIVSDFAHFYLDYSYKVMELIKSYSFDPHLPGITDIEAGNIVGVEGALWCEYVNSRDRIDWQMFPRLLAVSETAWTPKDMRDFDDFLVRLGHFEKRLDVLGVKHATRECYMKYRKISKAPHFLRILLSREHPAMVEYKQYHS